MALLASQFAVARQALQLTEEEIEAITGVESSIIADFERGNITLDPTQEAALISALGNYGLQIAADGSINEVTQLYFMAEHRKFEIYFSYPLGNTEIIKEIIGIFGSVDGESASIELVQQVTGKMKKAVLDILRTRGKEIRNLSKLKIFIHEMRDVEFFLILPGKPQSTKEQLKAENFLHNCNNPNAQQKSIGAIDQIFDQLLNEYNVLSPNTDVKNTIGNTSRNRKKCRFCNRTFKDGATFSDEAHALPRAFGNKNLILGDECDTCNHFFGDNIEPSLINMLEVQKSILGIQGRSKGGGRPTLDFSNGSISRDDKKLSISSSSVTKNGDEITVALGEGRSLTPIAVYRALVKIVLSVIDPSLLEDLAKTVEWVRFDKHTNEQIPNVASAIINLPPNPSAQITVYTRKTDASHLPHIVGEFRLGCFVYVFAVPFSAKDNWNLVGFFDDEAFRSIFGHYLLQTKWIHQNLSSAATRIVSPTLKFLPKS